MNITRNETSPDQRRHGNALENKTSITCQWRKASIEHQYRRILHRHFTFHNVHNVNAQTVKLVRQSMVNSNKWLEISSKQLYKMHAILSSVYFFIRLYSIYITTGSRLEFIFSAFSDSNSDT